MDHSLLTTAIHEFMRLNTPLDDKGMAKLDSLAQTTLPQPGVIDWPTFMLRSAVTYAHVDAVKVLAETYGADLHHTTSSFKGASQGYVVNNLLHEALGCYRDRPDVDRSPAGKERLAATVEYLLQKGVNASPNVNPIDNPACLASQIADPRKSRDPKAREFDWLSTSFSSAAAQQHAATDKPYELIGRYQPDAVKSFEAASGKSGFIAQVISDIKVSVANLRGA